jgi:hypothetical protein
MFLRPEHHGDRHQDRQQLRRQMIVFWRDHLGSFQRLNRNFSLTVLALKNLTVQCYGTSLCNAHEMK